MTSNNTPILPKSVVFLVLVASLGYFVDIYDLLIFSIVRVSSLHDIGITKPDDVLKNGQYIINMQMFGLLAGGIVWGITGDKFGRVRVLFGSILLYSLANFANGFVADVNSYAIIRLIAGIGLAGELGAGITLVSETMTKESRGYGTMIVAAIGLFGAVAANIVAHYGWRDAYFIGGGLGIMLLLLRMGTFESGMFKRVEKSDIVKGRFWMLFNNADRFWRYLYCILIGMPLWFVVGILVTLSPEFGKELGAKNPLSAGTGIMWTYIGIAVGDIFAGITAQIIRSRKLTMLVFQLVSLVAVICYLSANQITTGQFIGLCLFMGVSVGYWATFVTIASEQFGTNLRATVTTTVPNFVRGSLIPITMLFNLFVGWFKASEAPGAKLSSAMIDSGYVMMALMTLLALFALSQLKESFGKDLNYLEE